MPRAPAFAPVSSVPNLMLRVARLLSGWSAFRQAVAAALVLLWTALLLSGCGGSETALPDGGVAQQSVALDVPAGTEPYTPMLDGPLRILSATPAGTMRTMLETQPVAVTFTRPMVPVGEAPAPPADALTLDPAVPGSLRWEGTQTLVFTPDAPLPPATAYTATLRPVLASVDGQTLGEPYTWTFETPRPRLVRSEPSTGARFVDPEQTFVLHFNQAVRNAAAAPFIQLRQILDGGSEASRPIRITNDGDSTLVVRPHNPLALDHRYVLELAEGLPGAAGSLGMADTATVRFTTYGPLQLTDVDQPGYRPRTDPRFYPNRGVTLSFSTPVRFRDLRLALSFDPEVELPPGIEARDSQTSTSHTLPVTLQPETTYRVDIENLIDAFGQTLNRAVSSFRTRAFEPALSMQSGILVIEADQYPILPLSVVNVETARLYADRLAADEIIPALDAYDPYHYYPGQDSDEAAPAQRTINLGTERNVTRLVPLRLDSLLTGATGVVAVRLQSDTPQRDLRALAQVTRLGLTTKFSPHQNLVLVTDLATGAPVSGATVTVRDADNTTRWTGTTDDEGRAQSPGWAALGMSAADRYRTPTQYVMVEHEGDLAFTSSLYDEGVEPYRFGLNYDWNPEPRTHAGSIFSDRGLYRAGETVHLKGILRTKTDGAWQSIQDSLRVLIHSPRDEAVLDRVLTASDLGTFHLDWTAPLSADQGIYTVRVGATDDTTLTSERSWQRGGYAQGTFRVDAFRRASFAVDATTSADSYVAGDFFEGTISARYLFGAGMAGQPVQYQLQQRTGAYQPPGYGGYRFGPLDDDRVYETLIQDEGTLDSTSTAQARAQLPGNPYGLPTTLSWSGRVTDPARQEIAAQVERTLHPGLFYIGLKPSTSFISLAEDSVLTVDVITVDPNGSPVHGKDVTVSLVREEYNSVREVGSDGRLRWRSERTTVPVHRTTLTTASGQVSRLRMIVPQGGRYRIRAEAQDVRGNAVRSDTYLYATGSDYVAWARSDDDRIDLVAARSDYAPGEAARIMVPSPYEEATALITVEREGIISSRVETLTGSAPEIEVPLDAEHIPNVYVSVILLNGRSAPPERTTDPGAPSFKIGYVVLNVDPGEQHLAVTVEPDRETYRPGDEVTVDLTLRDADGNGVAGEIAFAAADAGVLNLIGYALPDPFETFYGTRPLGVTTSETRAHLVEQRNYGQKAEDLGGGGGDASFTLRQDFRPLAHWAPAVRTDERGRATITFRLPESLTTFRLMATALTADHAFGNAQNDIVVTQPLVLKPALPRFARLNDTFEAGVLVSNRTGAAGTATVTAEGTGITRTGSASQTVQLGADETKEVRFAWQAGDVGEAAFTFTAEMGPERDAFTTTLPVQRPTTKEASATFASTSTSAQEALRLPAERVPGLGALDVQVASTALVGLDGAMEYLFAYPYGCLEQRTSRVRPLLVASDLLDGFDLDVLDGNRQAVVTAWLNDLDGYWTGDGFGLWTSARVANPYVTAYTVLALAEAEAAGFGVPQPLTGRALDALDRMVRNRSERPAFYSEAAWTTARALMLYALARHGRVPEGELSAMASTPPESVDALSYLLRTLTLADRSTLNRFRDPVATALQQRIRVEATRAYLTVPDAPDYGWIFASTTRATAFGLSALTAHSPTDDFQQLAERMVRYLMEQRTTGHWASTQENMAVVEALDAYYQAYETAVPDFTAQVQLARKTIVEETFAGRTLDVAREQIRADAFPSGRTLPVQVTASGTGNLYYSLRLHTYTSAPQDARAQGLSIERRLQRLDDRGEPVGDALLTGGETITLAPGQLVRVTLRLTSPADRNYVAVDDALPAGLEPVNAAFATTDASVLEQAGAGQSQWWGSFNHTELRDDRVLLFADYLRRGEHTYTYVARATTPGTFVHPPAEAEMMYAPETRGRTATGTLTVDPSADATAQR